jgi:ketosteroid isomerase-like protein
MLRHAPPGALSTLMLVASCASKEAPVAAGPAVDTAAVVAGVTDAWNRMAAAEVAGDVEALVATTTPTFRFDAMGAPPLIGQEAARTVWAGLFAETDYTDVVITPDLAVALTSDLAHSAGVFRSRYIAKGVARSDFGRFAAALAKGPDGQWRATYIMSMTDSTVTSK